MVDMVNNKSESENSLDGIWLGNFVYVKMSLYLWHLQFRGSFSASGGEVGSMSSWCGWHTDHGSLTGIISLLKKSWSPLYLFPTWATDICCTILSMRHSEYAFCFSHVECKMCLTHSPLDTLAKYFNEYTSKRGSWSNDYQLS